MGNSFAKGIMCALSFCLSIGCLPASALADGVDSAEGAFSASSGNEIAEIDRDDGAEGPSASDALAAGNREAASSASSVDGEAPLQSALAKSADETVSDAGDGQTSSASAEPECARIEDGFYTICSAIDSSFVLDVRAASSAAGANVQLWSGNGSAAQTWYVSGDENGLYTIESMCSGLFLDVQWASRDDGANVWQYSASSTPAQRWKLVERVSGASREAEASPAYSLVSECNGLALDVSGARAENGSNIQCYTPNTTDAQSFVLRKTRALPEAIYAIKAFSDQSKMVEVKWGLRSEGAQADLYTWNGSPAQRWKATIDSDGWYSFESVRSGLMLASAEASGGAVTQSSKVDSNATDAQKWKLSGNPSGGFRLVSKVSGLAVDLKGGDAYDGNVVQVFAANGSSAQGFIFKQPASLVSDGYYTVDFWATGYNSASGACVMSLDVAGASRDAGANVQLFTGNGTRAQVFHIRPNGDGTYTFDIPFSRKALDVRYGGMGPGTNVQQWDRNGSDGQKWRIEYDGTGAVRIVSVLNGLALQVAGSSGIDGANIEVGNVTGGIQQRFALTPATYVPEDFADHMAHFSTVSTNTINGWYNMSRALSNFDGMVVYPGQTVSFFDTCGPCGAAEGYLIAGVVGGEGYGGGICQASTTLYGAVLRAGLTIVERQNHTKPSTYVPIGQDAMVNWGSSDFRFRNDWDFPVKIVVDCRDRTLNCDIWGIQPDWYDTVEISSWWTGSNSAAAVREYYKNGTLVHSSKLPNSWYW